MRKDRNQFTNIILILTILCSLGLSACGGGGGGGGDGDGKVTPESTTWIIGDMVIQGGCHATGEIDTYSITIVQQLPGNEITITNDDKHESIKGTRTGNSISAKGTLNNDDGSTTTLDFNLTVSPDGKTISGTYTMTHSVGPCTDTDQISGTLSENGNLSGEWKGYRTTDGQAEEGPDLELFIQTGNDIVIMFYDDHEKVIVTQTGKLDGKNISISFVSPHGGDTITGTGTINNNNNSMSGTWTSTDGSSGTWRAVKFQGYTLTPKMTWLEAENLAVSLGGHLVTINDRNEELWLKSKFGTNEYFWIGFNDLSEEGNWQWISGEPVVYTNWWSGEPNNTGSHGEPENAAIMNWGGDGGYGDGWNDNSENNKFRGIVELE